MRVLRFIWDEANLACDNFKQQMKLTSTTENLGLHIACITTKQKGFTAK